MEIALDLEFETHRLFVTLPLTSCMALSRTALGLSFFICTMSGNVRQLLNPCKSKNQKSLLILILLSAMASTFNQVSQFLSSLTRMQAAAIRT